MFCKCNNTILSDSRTPNTHKLLYKSFWWHTHPWFNASPLPSELQPKNWKPNHTQISNNAQNAQICKTRYPPHIFWYLTTSLCTYVWTEIWLVSAIESCTYLHPPNMDMNIFLDHSVENYHTNMYNTCLYGHKF